MPTLQHSSARVASFLICPEAASFGTSLQARLEKRCSSMWRTFWGGSFVAFQATTLRLAFPSVFDPSRGCYRRIRSSFSHVRDRSCHLERRRLTRAVPHYFASCTVASFISAVFRYAKWTFNAALPDEDSSDSSFLISPGGAPGFFTGPSQVCSRKMGEPSPFLALGPTCRFARSRLHAPIYFRRGDFRVGKNEVLGELWRSTSGL